MNERNLASENIPLDKPSPARMYDYFLGGHHNFAIDRMAADEMVRAYADFPLLMQVGRAFLGRAVQFLAEHGIEQFLDIGSGVPTVGNVHEVAQRITPTARVVYVDIDPVAVSHSTAILQGNPYATVIQADARQPHLILAVPNVQHLLDFDKPIAVLLAFFLHFVTDDEEAYRLVRVFRDALVPGSYLMISHGSLDNLPTEVVDKIHALYSRSTQPVKLRSRAQIEAFFNGLELVEPGIVHVPLWRPSGPEDLFVTQPERSSSFGGIGYKP